MLISMFLLVNYNILNIVVNTEQEQPIYKAELYYNILNIVVNTELSTLANQNLVNYNILNIVVNTEQIFHT